MERGKGGKQKIGVMVQQAVSRAGAMFPLVNDASTSFTLSWTGPEQPIRMNKNTNREQQLE